MICEVHGTYYDDNSICLECWRKSFKKMKADRIKEKISTNKSKYRERENLKNKLQRYVSQYAKMYYKSKGLYYDWISGKSDFREGLMGLHASHYYAKGNIWQLWTELRNIGLSSYYHNVIAGHTVTLMRRKMVEVWGEDQIKELDDLAAMYEQRIKLGIETKYPSNLWIQYQIDEIKNKIKLLKKEFKR